MVWTPNNSNLPKIYYWEGSTRLVGHVSIGGDGWHYSIYPSETVRQKVGSVRTPPHKLGAATFIRSSDVFDGEIRGSLQSDVEKMKRLPDCIVGVNNMDTDRLVKNMSIWLSGGMHYRLYDGPVVYYAPWVSVPPFNCVTLTTLAIFCGMPRHIGFFNKDFWKEYGDSLPALPSYDLIKKKYKDIILNNKSNWLKLYGGNLEEVAKTVSDFVQMDLNVETPNALDEWLWDYHLRNKLLTVGQVLDFVKCWNLNPPKQPR